MNTEDCKKEVPANYIYSTTSKITKAKGEAVSMIKKIFLFICAAMLVLSCASIISAADSEKLIFMNLNYKDNAVTVKDMAVGNGFYLPFEEDTNIDLDKCSLKVFDKKKEIFSTSFYVDNKRFKDFMDENGELTGSVEELNDVNFSVIIPYNNIEKIAIDCPTNKIILNHADIDLKPLVIPVYKEKDGDRDNSESKDSSANSQDENKSIFLQFIGIVEDAYHYIFG
jgi:hypothetical protein